MITLHKSGPLICKRNPIGIVLFFQLEKLNDLGIDAVYLCTSKEVTGKVTALASGRGNEFLAGASAFDWMRQFNSFLGKRIDFINT